jgi:hypothetical protein
MVLSLLIHLGNLEEIIQMLKYDKALSYKTERIAQSPFPVSPFCIYMHIYFVIPRQTPYLKFCARASSSSRERRREEGVAPRLHIKKIRNRGGG